MESNSPGSTAESKWSNYNDFLELRNVSAPVPDPVLNATRMPTSICNNPLYFMPVDMSRNMLWRNIIGQYGISGPSMDVVPANELTGAIPAINLDPLPRWGDFNIRNQPPYSNRAL